MGLFSRRPKRVEPYDLFADDQEQLEIFLGRGADATAARELEVSLTFSRQASAEAASEELRASGVWRELCEPSHDVPEWTIVATFRGALVPGLLREAIDRGHQVAEAHGGEFEAWTAMYTAEEKAAWGVEPL
ncbi:ribonuclease E inhibitor RraB [Demequina sp. NBRC 110051]|uniref:ribonuclease E inhibitor RraB n=1 Tax=Demequina sp. NBRC 110051 TaxID=1570340 RepID=UPI00117D3C5F|nr:ribonuclease E inhibitor RraB [Demequina sp. NBRC 110051]